MSDKHLKLEPHNISETCWWYEEKGGINIVTEFLTDDGRYVRTEQHLISWPAIRAALSRKDRKP